MTVAAVIQARMSSSRLPGKVLLPAAGREMLAHQVDRVRRAARVDRICIATTGSAADDRIAALAGRERVAVFRGSEDDVLDRFARAAETVGATVVIRLTGDCPLIDPVLIDDAVAGFTSTATPLDYLSNGLELTWPVGLDIEVMTIAALRAAAAEATDRFDREHVTPFIYRNPDRFRIRNIRCPEALSMHRWTLDEPADYELIRRVFEALLPGKPDFGWRDVLELLAAHPDWLSINSAVRQTQNPHIA